MDFSHALLFVAAAVMLCGGAIAAAIGIAMIGARFLDGAARQPELIPVLRSQFFVLVGLVDAMPVITIAMGLYVIFVVAA